MVACKGSTGGDSALAEPYRAHGYAAAARAPQTFWDQQHGRRPDLYRQQSVHEPAITATFSQYYSTLYNVAKNATWHDAHRYNCVPSIIIITIINKLGRKIASISGDNWEPSFLFQSISITVQHFNSIILHNSFSSDEEWPLQLFVLL